MSLSTEKRFILKNGPLLKLVQFMLTCVILIFLIRHIEMDKISRLLRHVKPGCLCVAFLLLTTQMMIAAYRWLMLLQLAGYSPPIWQCIGSFGMGNFVNAIIPGGVGGDITRTVITARRGIPTNIAAYSVLLDRIITLAGLCLMVVTILLGQLSWSNATIPGINKFALIGSLILLIAFFCLVLIAPSIKFIPFKIPKVFSLLIHLSKLLNTISQQKYQFISLSGIIFISHVMLIIVFVIIAYSLHVTLSLKAILIGLPIALFYSVFPITPGGWGLRESALVLVLGQFQISPESAFSISIIFGVLSTFSALPIAMLWWFLPKEMNHSKLSTRVC